MNRTSQIIRSIEAVLAAETDDFLELARIAELDPAHDFENVCLRDIDLSGLDLRRFSFCGADLRGASLKGARLLEGSLEGATIDGADLAGVIYEKRPKARRRKLSAAEKARREEAWSVLEKAFNDGERVTGSIFGRVKGGFTVDLSGPVAFLPGSQVDVLPVGDVTPLMGTPQPFQILKMDRRRGNIVVSRRAVLEESRAEQRAELLAGIKEGQVLDGVVKNLTDYGAFVDLGGVDGLLHVTDIAWRRINHPSEVLSVGQNVNVQVIRFNTETQRISLGMKQLEADPWDGVEAKYPVGTRFTGRVFRITDYGAFVELEPGVEGLVHVSEMSWTKKSVHPGSISWISQEVEVMVLDVDPQKRRISLGIKQTQENPWTDFETRFPVGTEIEGEIKNVTEFGLFVGLPGEIDGMVHLSDLDWNRAGEETIKEFKKGDVVKAKILDVDVEKERISLGIKQLRNPSFGEILANVFSERSDGRIDEGSTRLSKILDDALLDRMGDVFSEEASTSLLNILDDELRDRMGEVRSVEEAIYLSKALADAIRGKRLTDLMLDEILSSTLNSGTRENSSK